MPFKQNWKGERKKERSVYGIIMNFRNFREIINKKKKTQILLGQMQKNFFLSFSFWEGGDDGLNSGHKIYHN